MSHNYTVVQDKPTGMWCVAHSLAVLLGPAQLRNTTPLRHTEREAIIDMYALKVRNIIHH